MEVREIITIKIAFKKNCAGTDHYYNILSYDFRRNGSAVLVGFNTSSPGASNGQTIRQAALEAIAFENRDVLEAMQNDSKIKLTTLLSDGGTYLFSNYICLVAAQVLAKTLV